MINEKLDQIEAALNNPASGWIEGSNSWIIADNSRKQALAILSELRDETKWWVIDENGDIMPYLVYGFMNFINPSTFHPSQVNDGLKWFVSEAKKPPTTEGADENSNKSS